MLLEANTEGDRLSIGCGLQLQGEIVPNAIHVGSCQSLNRLRIRQLINSLSQDLVVHLLGPHVASETVP